MKFHMFRYLLILLLTLAPVRAHADIRIGTAGPLSGQYGELGKQMVRGVEHAVADLNAAGGVNGEKLVLETADDACEPRKAIDIANAFIAKGVVFVAGHYCSFASIPAAPLYAAAGILMISPSASHPGFTDGGDWNTNRIVARDDAQGEFAASFVARRYGSARVAVLDDGSPYATSLTMRFTQTLAAAGQKPVIAASFKPGDRNFAELAGRLKEAEIDVVYAAGHHPEIAPLVREMRAQGLGAQLVSGDTLVTDEYSTLAGDAAEGTLMTFAPDPLKFPAAASLIARLKQEDISSEGATLYGYAAVQTWAQAAKATGGTDGRKIAQWLRAGNVVSTVIGDLRLDSRGDVNQPGFVWYRWSDGKYVLEPMPGNDR
jgi:branched-chain amino acid transport system substrate-binding protein